MVGPLLQLMLKMMKRGRRISSAAEEHNIRTSVDCMIRLEKERAFVMRVGTYRNDFFKEMDVLIVLLLLHTF